MIASPPKPKPMPLWQSTLFFGIPALVELYVTFSLLPALAAMGFAPLVLFAVFMAPPALLLIAAIVAFKLEGREMTWFAFRERMRLGPLTGKQWAWSVGVGVAMILSYVAMWQATEFWQSFILRNVQSEPEAVAKALGGEGTFVGFPLQGAWWLLGVWFIGYFFNVVGEELWWRGYILPRQELSHGRWTWAIHGSQWTLFHIFNLATLWMILPGALLLSWYCQRSRNMWPGIVAHGLLNAMAAIRLVSGIIG